MLDLYRNIKKYRKEAHLSQEELAKKVGYNDRSSIAKIEKGDVDLPQSKIIAIAKALGVDAGTLMGWEDSLDGTAASGASPAPESSEDAIVVSDPDEKELIHAYRASPPVIRNAARRVLGLKEDGSSSSGEDGEFFARNNTA